MKLQLPKVHIAVNIMGLLGTVASGIGLFAVQNQAAIVSMVPAKDALLTTLVIAAAATFLPTKHDPTPPVAPAEPPKS